jgi:FeS assembly SUF system protein
MNDYADEFVKKFMRGDLSPEASTPIKDLNAANDKPLSDKPRADKPLELKLLEDQVVQALQAIYDPEIPVNIYDLGLIYDVIANEAGHVDVKMTLTTPGCPVAQTFPGSVEQSVLGVEGVTSACVELVWDPPWTKDRMSEAARLDLGLF